MVSEQLAQFARSSVTSASALHMMQLSLFDWASCGIAGRVEPVSQIVKKMIAAEGGAPVATIFDGAKAPPRGAALANGTISHALDFDDTHFGHIGHPSVAVLPAAFAVAEQQERNGADLLTAALIGAEASIRVGKWLGRAHYQIGFHQTATAGAFGATIAASRLLDLDEVQIAHAIGIVATRASGLKSQFGTMGKPFNAGIAAANGVEAAQLAKLGFVSNPKALEGEQGFGPTHHGAGDLSAFEGLGEIWEFEGISHKFHACCHGLHAMLEALENVQTDHEQIESIHIHTHPRWMSVCNIPEPQTGLETKFSYKMTAAMALSGIKTGDMASFSDKVAKEPKLIKLRDKVTVFTDETLTEMQARIEITEKGQTASFFHDLDAPMPIEVRKQKLRKKADGLLGFEKSKELWGAVSSQNLGLISQAMSGIEP